MKTKLFAEIYNPTTAEALYKMRKRGVNVTNFINSEAFSIAFKTASDIYISEFNY